jgi:GTP-binding protein HflX
LFDRYDAGEQAVLVHIYFSQDKDMEDLQEFETLASSAGVEAMQVITGSRKAPHPKYFVGEGKAVEIAEAVKATGASVVLFDHALSPAQNATWNAMRMPGYRSHRSYFRYFRPARAPMKETAG